jgi:hypothetical protein
MKTCVVSFRGKGLLLVTALWLLLVLRAFPIDLLVYNNNDSGPGSLRQAIADNNLSSGGNTIVFSNVVTGTILLTSGELLIARNVNISGPGPRILAVNGNYGSPVAFSRVFHITNAVTAVISGLTITNGAVSGSFPNGYGGGIWNNHSTLTLSNCTVAKNFGSTGSGGGIYNDATFFGSATLSIIACTISENTTFGVGGGGIYNYGAPGVATVSISASTITGNSVAGINGVGGGIFNQGSSGDAVLTISNSTFSSNGVPVNQNGSGGGIYNSAGSGNAILTVIGSTFNGNVSANNNGGNIFNNGANAKLEIGNTILVANIVQGTIRNTGSVTSDGYNLSSDNGGGQLTSATDQLNANALLGPLADNGGPTSTHALLSGSPAIDKGKSYGGTIDQRGKPRPFDFASIPNASGGDGSDIGAVEAPTPRSFVVSNLNNSGAGSLRQAMLDANTGRDDIITFATNVTGTITLISELTTTAPTVIRGPGPNLLSVSGNQSSRVFTILGGPTEISGLTIRDGRVVGSSGNQGNHGGEALAGGIYSQATLTLSNCVVRSNTVVGGMGGERHNGSVGNGGRGIGGGFYNSGGSFTLLNCSFTGNRAIGGQGGAAQNGQAGGGGNGLGAAISTSGGTNQITACDLADSTAQGGAGGTSNGGQNGAGGQAYGAGLYSESDVSILKSTFRGGSALGGASGGGNGSGYGGGIYNGYTLALRSCTITSNNASGSSFDFGGGVYSVGAGAGLTNCTIAHNQADSGGGWSGNANVANSIFAGNSAGVGADFNGTMNSYDYNLVQSAAGLNLIGATANVLIGVDPMLGPLADNGGPAPTQALLSNSPAIDKGRSFGFATDQRGAPRPYDFPSAANASGGDGSDIGTFESGRPALNIQQVGNSAVLSWQSYYGDFALQSVTNVIAANDWATVAGTPVVVANQYRLTNSPVSGNRFFRLRGK